MGALDSIAVSLHRPHDGDGHGASDHEGERCDQRRAERRPSPHTPWPLVQPPLTTVPKPTSRPATISWRRVTVTWYVEHPGKQQTAADQAGEKREIRHAPARLGDRCGHDAADAGNATEAGEQQPPPRRSAGRRQRRKCKGA